MQDDHGSHQPNIVDMSGISFQHNIPSQYKWQDSLQERIREAVRKTAEEYGKVRDEFTKDQLEGIIIEMINSGDIVRYMTRQGDSTLAIVPGIRREEMHALKMRIVDLENAKDDLLDSLKALLDEYLDRKAQFGSDYLWEKHECPEVIEQARMTISGMEDQPE
jgi:hypothetical protein